MRTIAVPADLLERLVRGYHGVLVWALLRTIADAMPGEHGEHRSDL